jgi:hypothetical protein
VCSVGTDRVRIGGKNRRRRRRIGSISLSGKGRITREQQQSQS